MEKEDLMLNADIPKGNHEKQTKFHKRMVQREWSKNKCYENSLFYVHLKEGMELFQASKN